MPKPDKNFPRWIYPPEYPMNEGRIVTTQEAFDSLIAQGWHKDLTFLNKLTTLRAEVKLYEKVLQDRKERLVALEAERSGEPTDDPEDDDVERVCNVCGMAFFTKKTYDEHMSAHKPQEEEE